MWFVLNHTGTRHDGDGQESYMWSRIKCKMAPVYIIWKKCKTMGYFMIKSNVISYIMSTNAMWSVVVFTSTWVS